MDAANCCAHGAKPARKSLGLLTPFTTAGAFSVERLPAPVRRGDTVLGRLRDQLLGNKTPKTRLPQDTSVQMVSCPGIMREVETVYNSILHNLQSDASLKQNDVAVLVTDMTKYRAALQAVFERPQQRLQYNLVDYSAAGASMFGQAVLGMLDLVLESFSRVARVCGALESLLPGQARHRPRPGDDLARLGGKPRHLPGLGCRGEGAAGVSAFAALRLAARLAAVAARTLYGSYARRGCGSCARASAT